MSRPQEDAPILPKRYPRGSFSDWARLADRKRRSGVTVTVVLPAREVADTIGSVLGELTALQAAPEPLVDQVVVVDADSSDGTAEIARGHGVDVFSENHLMPEYGPNLGKGDALWRGLSVARSDIVAFADTDTRNFSREMVTGVLGPLLLDTGIHFVKGAFRRPFYRDERSADAGGGRVTEIAAKPLLNLFFPQLAAFAQPLAGEFAARGELLRSLPFVSGYGVDIGLLIDAALCCGAEALAETDLGVRLNRHQTLEALSRMGFAVARTVVDRAIRAGAVSGPPPLLGQAPRLIGARSRRDHYIHSSVESDGVHTAAFWEPLMERPPLDSLQGGPPARDT